MKIRSGFVSNSSSSSFYISRTEKPIPFEKIPEYYELSTDLTEEERVWMSLCIWRALREAEKSDKYTKEDSDDDYISSNLDGLKNFLSDDNISWMQRTDYYKKPDGYWDKAKKLLTNPYGVAEFSIDSVEGLELSVGYLDSFKLPFDFTYDMSHKGDTVFTNPEKGICIG